MFLCKNTDKNDKYLVIEDNNEIVKIGKEDFAL